MSTTLEDYKMTAGASVLSMLNPVWKNDTISEKGKLRGLERQKFKMAAAGPETVKVIVRCRPMNRRENDLKCVVSFFCFFNIDLFFTFIKQLQLVYLHSLHRKKRFTSFPSPAGMSLTKLPLGRNNSVMTSLFLPRESLVVTSRLGTGNSRTFFLRCTPPPRIPNTKLS